MDINVVPVIWKSRSIIVMTGRGCIMSYSVVTNCTFMLPLQTHSTGHGSPRLRWPSPRKPETWCCPDSLTWTLSRTFVRTSMRCSRYRSFLFFFFFFVSVHKDWNNNNNNFLVFQTDKGFDKAMFERQMSVMRGQVSFHFKELVLKTVFFLPFSPLCPLFCSFLLYPTLLLFPLKCPTFTSLVCFVTMSPSILT